MLLNHHLILSLPVSARAHGGSDKAGGTGDLWTLVAAPSVEAHGLCSGTAIGSLRTLVNVYKTCQQVIAMSTAVQ